MGRTATGGVAVYPNDGSYSILCCDQVYGIISAQLVLTAAVASLILFVQPVHNFVTASLAFQLTFAFLPLLGMLRFSWLTIAAATLLSARSLVQASSPSTSTSASTQSTSSS